MNGLATSSLNGISLFAGVGGLDLGINLAIPSARTVCFVEREAYSAAVLVSQMEKGGLHPAPIWSDVITFDGEAWRGKVDFIAAGFPCQPWSKAGKLKKKSDERWLWDDIARVIGEVEPWFIVLENVPGLLDGGADPVLGSLASLGFDCEWSTIRASEIGANHHRERVFFVACRPEMWGSLAHANGPRRKKFNPPSLAIGEGLNHWSPSQIGFSEWWSGEPRVGRVVDGVAHRVDRIRACGNGVVPLQAAVAIRELCFRRLRRS